MALDPSIYAGFLRPPKGVAEYANDFQALDTQREATQANALQRMLGQAKLDEYGRQTKQANALQQFQRGLAGRSESDVLKAYRDAGYFGEAAGMEEGMLKRDKTRMEIGGEGAKAQKEQAQAAKAFGEAQSEALKRYRGALDYIDTPQGAQRWLQAQYSDPLLSGYMQALGPIEQAVTRIPTDPQGFAQWRPQAGLGMESWLKQQLERDKVNDAAAGRLETARLTERGQDITARGQNMVDARTRELTGVTRQIAADTKAAAADEKAVNKFSATLQKEGIPELETAVSGAEGALGRYAPGQVPGIGALKNALPAALMTDEGKDVRQALAQVRNIVLSARSGAAVTDQELRRLVEEIGTGAGMSEADIRKGLAKVRARVDKIKENAAAGVNDEVLRTYQDRGGIAIKRGGKTAAAPTASGFKYLGTE
jgi:hypothetical protein